MGMHSSELSDLEKMLGNTSWTSSVKYELRQTVAQKSFHHHMYDNKPFHKPSKDCISDLCEEKSNLYHVLLSMEPWAAAKKALS